MSATPTSYIAEKSAHAAFVRIRAVAREPVDTLGEPAVGWNRSRVDPEQVVEAARLVHLDRRYSLVGYQWYRDANGFGAVYAVPAGAHVPPPRIAEDGSLEPPPGALPGLAPALRFGDDGSALAHLERSFVLRELGEIGALGHGVRWAHHDLVTDLSEVAHLSWQGPKPAHLKPAMEPGPVSRLTYHTLCRLGTIRLLRHSEMHSTRDGGVHSLQETLATGDFGMVP